MDAIPGLSTDFRSLELLASQALNPVGGVQTLATSNLLASLLGQGSAIVNLSGTGQLLSIADTFQNQLAIFQPGAANSGGGQNFDDGLASLAAETQFIVDAVNNARNSLANLAGFGGLGSSGSLAAAFTQALSNVSRQAFANGGSSLTRLEQLGIRLGPSAAAGNSLSIDLDTLKAAFATDQTGAFSLLAEAADAFRKLAADTVTQAETNFATASALSQFDFSNQFFGSNSLLTSGNGFNLANLLFLESLGGSNSTTRQNLLALNEFNLVSALLG